MMEFGSNMGGLNNFQFSAPTTASSAVGDPRMRRQSTSELELGVYADMGQGMNMGSQQMDFSSLQSPDTLTMNSNNQFSGMPREMITNLMGFAPMMEGISEEESASMSMGMFSPTSYSNPYGDHGLDSMNTNFMMPTNDGLPERNSGLRSNENTNNEMMPPMPPMPSLNISEASATSSPQNMSMSSGMVAFSSPALPSIPAPQTTRESSYTLTAPTPAPSTASEMQVIKPEPKPLYTGIYSSSGFDMLGALMKVATRPNPEIDIGKVDMSCAFVVCDITLYDCPIIYVSDIFERLTGYNKHEVKGQNCRFLQSPEGKVQAGAKREFVDNDSVYYLKQRIADKKEAQKSVINYRKGGQPFMNLLTMIPITGEDNLTIKYFVGFQVDLVEKPTALEDSNTGGMYTVDYSQGMLPRYVWQPPDVIRTPLDGGQSISRDDVSTILSSINTNTESDLTKRMWDKVLLENTDDVVHVLSLKGLFLYLSPSSLKVLEYDPSELVGTALSSVCHPSDIVPVTRELKDTSAGSVVNVVFRIRRKKSGYTWFESHGSLCVEQGKGRKCIILVGRERPVYAIHRHDIEAAGGLGENEMWTKLSTSGMFLFVSSNVRTLLDQSPEGLIGTSIQNLMRAESRVEFGRSLEKARTGKRVTHKHEILNKRGLVLQAQTTIYPGDAAEGQKPTFLVAQTRLLKGSIRPMPPPLASHQGGNSTGSKSRQTKHVGAISQAGGSGLVIGSQDVALASEDNIFDELKTTRCTSWQYELRQMEKSNRILAEELASLLSSKKKRKRRKGAGHLQRDCANCHTRVTPEWRRGPSGQRDLCNSCGLRYAKQVSRGGSDNSGTIRAPRTGRSQSGKSQSDSSTSRS
jgi:PAS domain S-box-containing protein